MYQIKVQRYKKNPNDCTSSGFFMSFGNYSPLYPIHNRRLQDFVTVIDNEFVTTYDVNSHVGSRSHTQPRGADGQAIYGGSFVLFLHSQVLRHLLDNDFLATDDIDAFSGPADLLATEAVNLAALILAAKGERYVADASRRTIDDVVRTRQ